jgi:hypothetical protein
VASEDPEPNTNPKKELWKFILQTAISILTAILTALGASSCVHHLMYYFEIQGFKGLKKFSFWLPLLNL